MNFAGMIDSTLSPTTKPVESVRRLLDRAVFALLLALVLLAAVPFGSVDPWWEGVFEGCAFALGALWMIEGALGGRWLVREHWLLAPLVGLLAFAVAQTLPFPGDAATVAGVEVQRSISADSFETWRFVFKLAALLLCAAMWLRYTSSARRLRALVHAVVLTGLSSALFGVARQAAGAAALEQLSPRLAANLDGFAQFINRNHFAFLAEMTLGLVLGLLVGEWRRRRQRVPLYVAAALGVWAALVMSNSRGGLLGMLAELAFVALLLLCLPMSRRERVEPGTREGRERAGMPRARSLKNWLARIALIGCLLAAALVGVVWFGGERLGERLESVPFEMSGTSPVRWGDRRVEIWGATWRMIAAHPLTGVGVGFGAYRAAITGYHDASGEMSLEEAHNDYLELLACGGLFGAALAAWFALAFAASARRVLRTSDAFRLATCVGALGGIFAVLVHSLFDFGLHITINALVLTALAVVSVSDVRVEKKTQAVRTHARRRLYRLCACACALVCCWAAWHTTRAGASRLLSESAPGLASTEYEAEAWPLAEKALQYNSSDPEAHYALAAVSAQRGDDAGAVASLEHAVALRPRYYLTWLKLGRARERAGDVAGALAATRESIRLAPFYAEPHWQLGNALLRAGAPDEAFAELRLAASSRPALFTYIADLGWHAYGGDARAVVRATAPRDSPERVALARFFVKHGEGAPALELYRAGRADIDAGNRRALVADMIAAGKFREAAEVWADGKHMSGRDGEHDTGAGDAGGGSAPGTGIFNGGFESSSGRDEPGFDWRFAREQHGVNFSLDQLTPHGGARALLLDFDGTLDANARLVSQLVPVEAGARYRLSFAARSVNLVSGGMPFVALTSAAGDRLVAQTEALPRDTGGWRVYSLDFVAPGEALMLVIRRADCVEAVCPIFGRAWFDEFSLKKL